MKTKENAWAWRRLIKEIKEKVVLRNKKEKQRKIKEKAAVRRYRKWIKECSVKIWNSEDIQKVKLVEDCIKTVI